VGEAMCAAINPGSATVPLYREELFDKGFLPHEAKILLLGFTPNPDYFVDITDHIETKIKAVSVHNSQTPGFGGDIAARIKEIAQAMASSSDEEFQYAEAFRTIYLQDLQEESGGDQ
jgi:LmbE family N-acetylglucosaminyl deacetylase